MTPLTSLSKLSSVCQLLCAAAQKSEVSPALLPETGCVVFLSLCDGNRRAEVVHGNALCEDGPAASLEQAFQSAFRGLKKNFQKGSPSFLWLRADVVTEYASVNLASLSSMIKAPGWKEFFRYGISLDDPFEDAFLEEELNGAGILDYDQGVLSLEALNRYLKKAGRPGISSVPDLVHPFNTQGFLYEAETGQVISLAPEGQEHGQRSLSPLDGRAVRGLLSSSASWLARQVRPDGSFVYGFYPRFDHEIPGYNCMRHASTIWSLLCQYRLTQKEEILALAARSISYLIRHAVVFRDAETAYLSEPSREEIKLGGGAVLILALTEYMECSGSDTLPGFSVPRSASGDLPPSGSPAAAGDASGIACKKARAYKRRSDNAPDRAEGVPENICEDTPSCFEGFLPRLARALGNGILSLLDPQTGTFYHVLNPDFSRKEAYRTVYYDGESAYALCRLHRLFPSEKKWLTAAQCAVNHFLAADYTRYRDHWVAYAMNEITRYVHRDDYDTFALRSAQVNLDFLLKRETTYHTFLELLMVTFETYERILAENPNLPYLAEFDLAKFLRTIRVRADRMLNGFFFPETAMYMRCPRKILGTFFVRHDGFRVRIDDVQHNIGGFYLYQKYYERLRELGMPEASVLLPE